LRPTVILNRRAITNDMINLREAVAQRPNPQRASQLYCPLSG
jgi:hypothetical protein